jgi:prevent-host-death family protein
VKRISIAKAKEQLSSVIADVEQKSERYLLEEDGKPVAAVVSLADLERLRGEHPEEDGALERRGGLLALAGLFDGIMTDEEVDDFVRDIYEARWRDIGRPPPDFRDWDVEE